MPYQVPEHAVVGLLRQCFTTPRCQASKWSCTSTPTRTRPSTSRDVARYPPHKQQRSHTTSVKRLRSNAILLRETNVSSRGAKPGLHFSQSCKAAQHERQQGTKPKRIAVLGGGITGLASAHYLARELPHAKITLYEGSDRLGGWLQSTRVEVEKGTVVFEGGPRTLRHATPAGVVTLELITQLGLQDQLLITHKTALAAQNRFIYYPDRLVCLPGPGQDFYARAWSILTEPIFKGLLGGLGLEFSRPPRPDSLEDESVASFLERRLGGPDVGNNIASAGLHGIYAGDVSQLSAKSLLPKLWYYEKLEGSISQALVKSMTERASWTPLTDVNLQNEVIRNIDEGLKSALRSASVYTFREGIGTLSNALEKGLRANPNVEFKLNQKVAKLDLDNQRGEIKVANERTQPPSYYSNVISTLSGKNLSGIVSGKVPSLAKQHAVTVMVVNLYYRDPGLLTENGFGYLIPNSVPFEQNPECALGVVFDSDSSVGQDTAQGTKLTVMLGGHWWDTFDSYPTEEEGIAMAKSVLKRHLRVDDEPEAVRARLHRECIPQYVVGHHEMLKTAHEELLSGFNGKLTVAGNSYTGVGLNDCVRAARDVVMDLRAGQEKTGLEQFAYPVGWVQQRVTA